MIRILVIDDERAFSDIVLRYFTAMGCSVEAAASGEEGLERLEAVPFDILLVDNKLPGISGVEIVRRIRARGKDILIVMVTIDKEDEVRARLQPFGVDRYLKKPFRFTEMSDALIETITLAKNKQKGKRP